MFAADKTRGNLILAVCYQLEQLKKQREKIKAWTGFEPMTLQYQCNALPIIHWATKP